MKKLIYFIFCIVFVCEFSYAQNKAWTSSIKSGYIEYDLSGSITGTRYLWWDNYGRKMRIEEKSVSVVKMLGIKNEEKRNNVTVMVDGEFWIADLIKKTGHKGKMEDYQELVKFFEGMSKEEIKDLEEELINTFGGEKIGKGVVLGKECDIISVMGSKTWIYKGLSLKTELDIMGIKSKEIATIFKINILIPASKFKYVPGIEYTDMKQFQQEMFTDIDVDEDDEDQDEVDIENIENVNYSFDKFKSVVSNFKYDKYRRLMVISQDGQHIATFMKGFGKTLIITAASESYSAQAYDGEYETFEHKGFKCRYGDNDGFILIIAYPKYKMDIVLVSSIEISKEEMLKISDGLKF